MKRQMKKSLFAVCTFALLLPFSSAFASHKQVTVAVKGMVCGFCAHGIEKKFSAEAAIEKVNVSLSEKKVTLTLRHSTDISDARITQILNDSGYSVESVARN